MGTIVHVFILEDLEHIEITATIVSLAEHLTRAANDVSNDVAASLTAFATEEAAKHRQ